MTLSINGKNAEQTSMAMEPPQRRKRRAMRRQSFMLPIRDSELSQRRRQTERLQKLTRFAITSRRLQTWNWCLGIASCIEFICYVISKNNVDDDKNEEVQQQHHWWSFDWLWTVEDDERESAIMDQSAVPTSLTILYLLYFVNAFVHANTAGKKTFQRMERSRLLCDSDDDANNSNNVIPMRWWWRWRWQWRQQWYQWHPFLVGILSLLLQLALLPTWFWWQVRSLLAPIILPPSPLTIMTTTTATTSTVQEYSVVMLQHAEYSLGYAMLVQFYAHLSTTFQTVLAERGRSLERTVKFRLARFAIFHPRTFFRRFRKVQYAVIWIAYLAPIGSHIMNSNLVGVMMELTEQWWKQRKHRFHEYYCYCLRRYHRQQRRRRSSLTLSKLENDDACREELAATAIRIQRAYRTYRRRNWEKLVQLQKQQQEEKIILLVRNAMRKRTKQDLQAQEDALQELEALQERGKKKRAAIRHRRHGGNAISLSSSWSNMIDGGFELLLRSKNPTTGKTSCNDNDDKRDRRRKYQLQEEIRSKVDMEKQRLMLLRPDSKFVLRYKLGYVICAIIETAHLALQPRLEQQTTNSSNDNDSPQQLQQWNAALYLFFLHSHAIVNAVLCLGIFIQFFIGEFDSITGKIVQRSFFSRWIYPGILLHLLVNAAVADVSAMVRSLLMFVARAGPGKVYRWWTLFLFPIWTRLLSFVEWRIWIRLVRRENANLIGVGQSIGGTMRRHSHF